MPPKLSQNSGGWARSWPRAAKGCVGSRSPSKSWCQLTFTGEKTAKCSLAWSRLEFAEIFNVGSHFKLLGTKPRRGTLGLLTCLLPEWCPSSAQCCWSVQVSLKISGMFPLSFTLHTLLLLQNSQKIIFYWSFFFSIKKRKAVDLPNCFTALKCYFCRHSHRCWPMCFFFWPFIAD